jgi:hypothetical protein
MPPVSRTDFPYPLRTIDGEVDAVVDSIITTNLDVTGQTNVVDLYISGTTTIVGDVISLDDIQCLTITVSNTAQVNGLSTLSGGVNTTAIQCTNITSSGLLNGTNVTLSSLTPNQTVATNASKQLISVPSTGTGNNVLQNNPTINNLTLTGPLAASSLTLTTPLATTSGGTGTTSSTGTGQNVLQTNATLITPNIGTANATSLNTSGTVTASQFISTNTTLTGLTVASTADSTLVSNGSIVTNGGIGVGKNIVNGGVIQCNIAQNATSTSTGAIRALNGGISCAQDIFAGGNITAANFSGGGIINPADIFNITNTTNSTAPTNGSIQTSGGLGVEKDVQVGGNITANQLFIQTLTLNSTLMNFNSGTFSPSFIAANPAQQGLMPSLSYLTRVGTYQNLGKMTFLFINLAAFPTVSTFPNIDMGFGNIPGNYSSGKLFWGTWANVTFSGFVLGGADLKNYYSIFDSTNNLFIGLVTVLSSIPPANTIGAAQYQPTNDVVTVTWSGCINRTSP